MTDPKPPTPELKDLDPTPAPPESNMTADVASSAPPPMPPRPANPMEQAKITLKEAFPTVDDNVIEAVLIASGGNVEPAFNALLGMTDPTYKPEPTDNVHRNDPYVPPAAYSTSTPLTQLELDEQYARQLAGESRRRAAPRRTSQDSRRTSEQRQQGQGQGKEHSFIEDDLPVIKDNIKKGWSQLVSRVKSRLDQDPPEPAPPKPPRPGERQGSYNYQQQQRYDADPRVLGDDFSHLKLQDNSGRDLSSGGYHRPLANPDLFRTTRFSNTPDDSAPPPKPPRPDQGNNSVSGQPQTQGTVGPSPTKKWEPLKPSEDRDPFALGDSDDEEGKEDLYGTPAIKGSGTEAQETGIVSTPLDPAVGSKST